MRERVDKKTKQETKVLCTNKKEVKGNVNIENKWAIINKYSSLNISSEYNISGVAGYGLNLI